MEEPGGLPSMGWHRLYHIDYITVHRVAQLKRLSKHACIGEGNGSLLQYSCLENPRDRGAWWAAVYGVTQSQTRRK